MVLQIIISGLLLGGMYALIASGFSMVNGVMKLFNFAHGSFVMVGAYITYWFTYGLGLNPFVTILLSMLIMFVFGYAVQKYLINFIVKAPTYMTLMFTYGLDMVLVNTAILLWTANVRTTPMGILSGKSLGFLGTSIPVVRLIAFVIAVIVTVLLYLFMNKTRYGTGILATRMDLDAAKLVGVRISQTYAITTAVSAMLAGVAGSLISMVGPITPNMGSLYTTKAFAICILGGSGNMLGPLVGGLIMGLMETIGVAVFGAGYQEVVSFMVLILVLIIRPRGIFGKELF